MPYISFVPKIFYNYRTSVLFFTLSLRHQRPFYAIVDMLFLRPGGGRSLEHALPLRRDETLAKDVVSPPKLDGEVSRECPPGLSRRPRCATQSLIIDGT